MKTTPEERGTAGILATASGPAALPGQLVRSCKEEKEPTGRQKKTHSLTQTSAGRCGPILPKLQPYWTLH